MGNSLLAVRGINHKYIVVERRVDYMKISTVTATIALFIMILIVGAFLTLLVFVIRALLKYLRTKDVHEEKRIVKKSLGETLKEYRTKCKMTQEFVAESIGVSRQAVSKWEQGVSHS